MRYLPLAVIFAPSLLYVSLFFVFGFVFIETVLFALLLVTSSDGALICSLRKLRKSSQRLRAPVM
jgi:hypothetical protein